MTADAALRALAADGSRMLAAACSALLAFAIFGPLANLFLWAFAEKWYFPNKLPQEFGFTFWGAGVQSARRRARLARHQRLDRDADRRREPRRRDSRRLCAGAAQAALARR